MCAFVDVRVARDVRDIVENILGRCGGMTKLLLAAIAILALLTLLAFVAPAIA